MHDVDDSKTIGFNSGLSEELESLGVSEYLVCSLSFTPGTLQSEAIGLLDSSHPRSIDGDLSVGELTELVQGRQAGEKKKKRAPK
jgi:hypothetical protein